MHCKLSFVLHWVPGIGYVLTTQDRDGSSVYLHLTNPPKEPAE